MAERTWTFDTPANYVYDPGKIEITGGLAQLKRTQALLSYAHWHLNESAGAVAADASGNGRNGALINMESADWKPGKLNNCLEFDGTNEEINFGDIAGFERTDAFSLELWFKTGDVGQQDIFTRMMPAQPFTGWIIYMSAGAIQYFLVSSMAAANYIQVSTVGNLADSAWHHIIVTYDGSSTAAGIHIYIDGNDKTLTINRDSLSASMQNAEDCRMGARDQPVNHFEGQIDEAVIYNKELSPAEVATRWNLGEGKEENPTGDYSTDKPTIRPANSWHSFGLLEMTAFTEALGPGNQGTIRYQLSDDDGETWQYWNGSAWVQAGADDHNDAATVQANIGAFEIDSDRATFLAFLISDGTQKAELATIGVTALKVSDWLQEIKAETNKIQAMKEEVQFLKDVADGCWEIKNNQLILYKENTTTELVRFNLYNKLGKPTEKHVYKRYVVGI